MDNKIKWTIFGVFIVITISLIIWLFVNRNNENIVIPPPTKTSIKNIYNRKDTDNLLRSISTKIYGTESTPIYIIDNFLSDSECDSIISSVKDNLVASPLTRVDPNDANFRTSKTGYFSNSNTIQNKVNKKILDAIKIPEHLSEIPQAQKYSVGNEFKAHWDAFDKESDRSFYDKGQRTWTFMIYLNDVEEGGETYFPKLKQAVKPKKGTCVVWCNIKENYDIDRDTMHQGTPVKKGEKYIITKWFKLDKNP